MFKFVLSIATSVSLLALNFGTSHASHPYWQNNNNDTIAVARNVVPNLDVIAPSNQSSMTLKSGANKDLTLTRVIVEDEEINGFLSARRDFLSSQDFLARYKIMFAQGDTFFGQYKKSFSHKKDTTAYCIGLLQSYILEWQALVAVCGEYFSEVSALQGQIIENVRILDYIRGNASSFPKNRKSPIALVDGLTKPGMNNVSMAIFMESSTTNEDMLRRYEQGLQEVSSRLALTMEELSNPLTTGVEAFKKFLKGENSRHAKEMGPLVGEYKKYAERFQLIAVELGTDTMGNMMAKAAAILSEQAKESDSQIKSIKENSQYEANLREIHEDLRWLKDRVNNRKSGSPVLRVFYAAFDQPWHNWTGRYSGFVGEVIQMFDSGVNLDELDEMEDQYESLKNLSVEELIEFYKGKPISVLFRFYNNQEVIGYLQTREADGKVPVILECMNRSLDKLKKWHSWHKRVCVLQSEKSKRSEQTEFLNGMMSLTTTETAEPSFLIQKSTQP